MPEQDHQRALPDGRALAYATLGAASGPLVVVLDGPGSRGMARAMSATAATLGIRLAAPDRPGFGASTFSPTRTIADWPADHAALLDALGADRAGVVGHSGGTPFAIAAAAARPERNAALALVGPVAPTAGDTEARRELGPDVRRALTLATRAPWLLRIGLRAASRKTARDPAKAAARLIRSSPPADQQILADPEIRAMHEQTSAEILRDPDAFAYEIGLLARPWGIAPADVTVPVALWSGSADETHPTSHAHRLAALMGDAPVHVVPDAATFALLPRFGDVLRFATGPLDVRAPAT